MQLAHRPKTGITSHIHIEFLRTFHRGPLPKNPTAVDIPIPDAKNSAVEIAVIQCLRLKHKFKRLS